MASKYIIIEGEFFCGTCKNTSSTARLYSATKNLTWMCSSKHLTEVSLKPQKKTKRDYE